LNCGRDLHDICGTQPRDPKVTPFGARSKAPQATFDNRTRDTRWKSATPGNPLCPVFSSTWPGYRFTVEHSVHVRADCRGQGIGQQLVKALFPLAASLGKHVMIAGVDAANEASIRFHERLGFEQAGRPREVGPTNSIAGSISFFYSVG
jgi:GNAT superfamily N-acetyltransferase